MFRVKFDNPLTVNLNINLNITHRRPAVRAILKTKLGGSMPGQITVDTTDETVTVSFVDDRGNETTAPKGTVVSFATSNEAVATVAVDSNLSLRGDITPTGVGTCDVSASFGGTALEEDGTPIADPASVSLEVDPGAAVGARMTLAE